MQIDKKLLSKLEKLSALKINDEKRNELINQLSEIVNFVEKLNELDLSSLQATINTIEGGTPFRKDEVKVFEDNEALLANAVSKELNMFKIPKVIQ